jgi:hypothetical protein
VAIGIANLCMDDTGPTPDLSKHTVTYTHTLCSCIYLGKESNAAWEYCAKHIIAVGCEDLYQEDYVHITDRAKGQHAFEDYIEKYGELNECPKSAYCAGHILMNARKNAPKEQKGFHAGFARRLHPLNCVAYFVSHSLKTVMEEAALQRQWHTNNKILVPFASKHAADMAVLSLRCQVMGENGMLNKSLVFGIRFMHTYFCIR